MLKVCVTVTLLTEPDVLNKNEKLILGLMWTLVLQYHLKGNSLRGAKQELANFVEDLGVSPVFGAQAAASGKGG